LSVAVGVAPGRSGNLSFILCSTTVAASASMPLASSFALSKFSVSPLLCPASIIIPLSMVPICSSSLPASGKTPTIAPRMPPSTPTMGASAPTMSPSSLTVFSLRVIWSKASLACITVFSVFRISASSLENTLACCTSCFW